MPFDCVGTFSFGVDLVLSDYDGKAIYILAPVVRSRKGHYRELFESMRRKGYLNMRVDGQVMDIVPDMKVDRYKNHNIEVVVDKLVANSKDTERLKKSIEIAMKLGEGLLMLLERGSDEPKYYEGSSPPAPPRGREESEK